MHLLGQLLLSAGKQVCQLGDRLTLRETCEYISWIYRNQECDKPKSCLMFMNRGFPEKTWNQWRSELITTRTAISGIFQDFGSRSICDRWKSFASKCVVEQEHHYHNSDNPSKASLGKLPAPPSGAVLQAAAALLSVDGKNNMSVYTEWNISSAQLSMLRTEAVCSVPVWRVRPNTFFYCDLS